MLEFLSSTDAIRQKLCEKGINASALASLVKQKQEELCGLLSEEAAVYLIAKENGIKDEPKAPVRFTPISELKEGMRANLFGTIGQIHALKTFDREGKTGSVLTLVLEDGSGAVRVVLWNYDAQKAVTQEFGRGDSLELLNVNLKSGIAGLEAQLGATGTLRRTVAAERRITNIADLPEGVERDVLVRVLKLGATREFEKNVRKPLMAWSQVGDDTGKARLVLWEPVSSQFSSLSDGIFLKIEAAVLKSGKYGMELHANSHSKITINPKEADGKENAGPIRRISELAENENCTVEAALEISSVCDSPRKVCAKISDETGAIAAEFSGNAALQALGIKHLAEDILLSTVYELKKKELSRKMRVVGVLSNGKFDASHAAQD